MKKIIRFISNSEIVNSDELTSNDKTMLISTAATLKYFISDFKTLVLFVAENYGTNLKRSFLSKLWKGVKKVVSAVVSVVVNVVVNIVTSAASGYSDGQVMAPFCAVAGAVTGFFEGPDKGIDCKAFDFKYILKNSQEGGC